MEDSTTRYNIGQEIHDSMPSWSPQTDEEALDESELTNEEVDNRKAASQALSQSGPPIHAAAVVNTGPCQLIVTSINRDRKRDCLVAKVHAEHCETGGFSDFTLCVPLDKIRRIASKIMRVRHGVEISGAKMGSFLDDIGDAISSVASGAVNAVSSVASDVANTTGIGEVVKGVEGIANLPGFKQALGVGGMIFPPLGVSLSAINAAGTLINKASAGNQPAKQQILNVMQAGWNGQSPAAVKAATTLSTVYQAKNAMDVQAPVLTRTLNNAIRISLLPGATEHDHALVGQLMNFFKAIAQGPIPTPDQMAPYFPQQGPYQAPGMYGPGMAPSQGQSSFDSGGTHVVISGWSFERIKKLKKRMMVAGIFDELDGAMKRSPKKLNDIYHNGSRIMLSGWFNDMYESGQQVIQDSIMKGTRGKRYGINVPWDGMLEP